MEHLMNKRIHFPLALALAAGCMAVVTPGIKAQSKSEATEVREAIRFERAKESASRRQLHTQGLRPQAGPQSSEANRSAGNRGDADRVDEGPSTGKGTISDAIRYERFKDAAAARQMKKDANKQ